MRTSWISLIFLLSLVFAGCAPSVAEPPPQNPQEAPSEESSPVPPNDPLQFGNTPEPTEMPANSPPVEKFVSLAKKDLAERLQVAAEGIALVKAAEMVWPNAALGCPRPGKVYAPGKVPGYQILLEAGGMEYIYNTDLSGQIVLCPQYKPDDPGSLPPGTPGPTQQIGVPID